MPSAAQDALWKVRKGLHDLAQPLTALQCRLWLGTVEEGSEQSFRSTVEESLVECERMIASLRTMQEQVDEATQDERTQGGVH